ncbi:hypothetical protein H5410_021085 [Solanum commersonii]|uniref:Uncharacterized protein n=1 Tax=Solanum commersonii TaxID=4109 RepID=A0A9J5ZE62_SOLCO|nr:hypothetical protein H5410_021085 [Solanum commersonii]
MATSVEDDDVHPFPEDLAKEILQGLPMKWLLRCKRKVTTLLAPPFQLQQFFMGMGGYFGLGFGFDPLIYKAVHTSSLKVSFEIHKFMFYNSSFHDELLSFPISCMNAGCGMRDASCTSLSLRYEFTVVQAMTMTVVAFG